MAAKLASNQGGARGGGERQEAGPCQSYASVLNPKSASQSRASSFNSNNKENIGEQVTVSQQPQQQQQQQQTTTMVERLMPSVIKDKSCQRIPRCQATRTTIQHPMSDNLPEKDNRYENAPRTLNARVVDSRQDDGDGRLNNGDVSNDGEFRTVANKGARRKEKMREQHRESHRERHRLRENNNRHQQQPRGPVSAGGVGRRGSDERAHRERGDRNGVVEHGVPREAHHYRDDQNAEGETQPVSSVPPPVKYVEAPLPAVNPWTKNRPSTSQPTKAASQQQALNVVPSAATSTCPDRERRILQPQQRRETIGELRYFFRILTLNIQRFRRILIFDSLRDMRAKLIFFRHLLEKLFVHLDHFLFLLFFFL